MKKTLSSVLKLVAAVMAVVAVVCTVAAFWDRIMDLFDNMIDRIEEKRSEKCCDLQEYDDFADYDDSLMM